MNFTYGHVDDNGHEAAADCVSRLKAAESSNLCCCSLLCCGDRIRGTTMDQGKQRSTRMPDHEEHILQAVENNPGISTRQVALVCHVS